MKKIFPFLSILLCLSFLFSCSEKTENQDDAEVFTPLFRFTVSEGESDKTRLFYLAESDGFLYLHPDAEGGFTGGFVSPSRSISSEGLLQSDADLPSALVWESEKDRAYVLTDKELIITLLKENGAHSAALPEDLSATSPFAVDDLTFAAEKDDLLLLYPVDLQETYVLAQTSLLPDFAHLIAVGSEGKRLWYAKADAKGNYTGIAFFEYGANIPLGSEDFSFDKVQRVGENALLFTRFGEDRSALYTYRNLDSGVIRTFTAKEAFEGVSCDAEGTVLCGSRSAGEGGSIHVIDLEKGKEKGSYTINYGTPAPSLAIDKEGKTLLVAIGAGSDEILGTLDLTKY